MSVVKTIARNTVFLASSQVITIALGLFYIVYITRYLRADGYGILSIALVFSSICLMLTDFGLSTLTTREIAKDRTLTDKYFGNVAIIKLLLFSASLVVILVATVVFRYPLQTLEVIFIVVFSMIFSSLTNILNSIFQAYEVMGYQSIGSIINSTVSLFGALAVIHLNLGILGVAALYLLSNGAGFLYSFMVYRRKFATPKIVADLRFCKAIFIEAVPFGLTSIFSTLYVSMDVIILSMVWGNNAVGLYSAAIRLVNYLIYIPAIINIAILPVMAKYFISSDTSLKRIVEQYSRLMLIIAFPIGMAMTILSSRIIFFVYGDGYAQSSAVIQIIIWGMVLCFSSASFVRLFESIGKQGFLTRVTFIALLTNIIFNVLLIPGNSYIGSSIAYLMTNFTTTVLVLIYAYKYGYVDVKSTIIVLLKVLISSLIMSEFIYYFIKINLPVLIIASMGIYFLTLYVLNGVSKADIDIIKTIIKKS
jgi:O-antigen/teichoic acid export membrane protein